MRFVFKNKIDARIPSTAILAACLTSACAIVDKPLFAPKALLRTDSPAAQKFVDVYPDHKRVNGKACFHSVFFIPVSHLPTIDEAMNDAISSVPGGQALADVDIKWDFFLTLFYNRSCYKVTGRPVALRSNGI